MRRSALLAVLFVGFSACAADEPAPPPKPLPPVLLMPLGRTDRYAAWQNYSVDRAGHWRPRVLYTPDGAFYYYNGRPFPWMTVRPLEFMPYASD